MNFLKQKFNFYSLIKINSYLLNFISRTSLNQFEIEAFKRRKQREKGMKQSLKDILIYWMFIWVMLIVAFSRNNLSSFGYKQNLQSLFKLDKNSEQYSFTRLQDAKEVWHWLKETLLLNGFQSIANTNQLSDMSSYLIGKVIIRQLRVKHDKCSSMDKLKEQACFFDYNFLNEETNNFGLSWSTYKNDNNISSQQIVRAFQYTDSLALHSSPYIGIYSTYSGGGYVYSIDTKSHSFNLSQVISDLDQLQRLDWIDKQTRALFVQFSLYNPNVNLFVYSNILFEFLSTGNLLSSFRIDPFVLYDSPGLSSLTSSCQIIYMFIIVFFMLRNIRSLIKIGFRKCFSCVWFYADWLLIIFSWASFAMFVYRLYARNDFADKLASVSLKYQYINLQSLCYWNDLYVIMIAVCSFLSVLKLLHLIGYSRNIEIFLITLRKSFKELSQFSLIFLIVWFAFVNLLFAYFGSRIFNFRTLQKTITTSFQIIIGKFTVTNYLLSDLVLAAPIFVAFTVFVIFIILNVFLRIFTGTYSQTRKEYKKNFDPNELVMFDYLKEKTVSFLRQYGLFPSKKEIYNRAQLNPEHYVDTIELFEKRTIELINFIYKNYEVAKGTKKLLELFDLRKCPKNQPTFKRV